MALDRRSGLDSAADADVGAAAGRGIDLEATYARNAAVVYGLLLRILGDASRADAHLVRVFEDLVTAGIPGSAAQITTWLVRRARQSALGARRGVPAVSTPSDAPGSHVVPFCRDARRVAQIQARLARLAPPDRAMLELAYFDGLTPDAIAERCGLDESAVRTRLRHALCGVAPERAPGSKEATT